MTVLTYNPGDIIETQHGSKYIVTTWTEYYPHTDQSEIDFESFHNEQYEQCVPCKDIPPLNGTTDTSILVSKSSIISCTKTIPIPPPTIPYQNPTNPFTFLLLD